MVGKKRTLRPQSQNKIAMSIAASLAGRMGVVAESPLGSYLITATALQSSSDWYQKRSVATAILHTALGKLGQISPMDHAKVNALASAASKVVLSSMRGTLAERVEQVLDDALTTANKKIGAPDAYVNAVKEAALAYLGQVPGAPS